MPKILASKLPALRAICRKHKIKRFWAFGSVLREDFRKDSDIDFLYELDRPAIADEEYLSNLDGFIVSLLNLFPGRKLDLVYYPGLKNPYFIEEVDETKVLLYDQKPEEVSV